MTAPVTVMRERRIAVERPVLYLKQPKAAEAATSRPLIRFARVGLSVRRANVMWFFVQVVRWRISRAPCDMPLLSATNPSPVQLRISPNQPTFHIIILIPTKLTMQPLTPVTPKMDPTLNTSALSTSPGPATPNTPGTLAERVAAMELGTAPAAGADAPMRRSSSAAGGVLDNGTNIGSLSGRKASVGAGNAVPFNMERRTSQSGSARMSRRGSGVVMTPHGTNTVYHTRTDVRISLIRGPWCMVASKIL